MSFEKMKPIEGGTGDCGNCGYQHNILPLDSLIAVGFGYAAVTKNEEGIYAETEEGNIWNVMNAEIEARKEPDNDWRIHLIAPLSERHYQRQGKNQWVLYEKGQGFA